MKFLENFLSEEYIQALGWTFLHSIWQAALVALLLGILMIVVHRSSQIRYAIAASAMPLILVSALITFFMSFNPHSTSDLKPNKPSVTMNTSSLPTGQQIHSDSITHSNFVDRFKTYFSNHFPLVITLWFLGIMILTLRFLGNLAYVQRLKKYKIIDITDSWAITLRNISSKIGLEKPVRLLESSMISVPIVVGYIKPVILFPVGTITGLSLNEIESILAHELAHIQRKDYLVNIFQTLIEILFFYHPAVWWISSRVREERENCCDDVAVHVNNNSLVYAKALTSLGEMQLKSTSLAMAASGSSGVLFKRIKRLLNQTKQAPTFSEGFVTACILFVCVFSISLVAKANFTTDSKSFTASNIAVLSSMTDGDYKAVVLNVRNEDGGDDNLVIIKNKKGKIIDLYVNGRRIPKNEIKNYTAIIEESLARQNDGSSHSDEENKATVRNMLKELDHQVESEEMDEDPEINERPEIAERPEPQERPEKVEVPERLERGAKNSKQGDSSAIINNFTNKSFELAKLAMEMGQLNMEMESLQKKMKSQKDSKKNKAEVNKIERQIKECETKIKAMEKKIEKSGQDLGKMSIDIAKTELGNFHIDIDMNEDEEMHHYEGPKAKGKYVCPPCTSDCHHQTFEHPGTCPVCMMELIKLEE